MSVIKPSLPKGTRDFPPEVMIRREHIFETIKESFRKFGFMPLQTPSIEKLDVLTGKYGEEGDRLIFRILNSGDYLSKTEGFDFQAEDAAKSLTPLICNKALRYDLTVPFARFVVMNKHTLNFPFKRYQMQPVWRAESPQKGRYREFYQCDADVIGTDSLLNDAELIALYDDAFSALGFPSAQIIVSNRKILAGIAEQVGAPDKLTDICIAIDKLDKIGEEKVKKELEERGIAEARTVDIFRIIAADGDNQEKLAYLREQFTNTETGQRGLDEMEQVLIYAEKLGIKSSQVIFDPRLARGLDYYTGTIYEVKSPDYKAGSLGGGGRYDDLTGIFGDSGLAGVGISFGADRIFDAMEALDLFGDITGTTTQVLLANFGGEAEIYSLGILSRLRDAGISAEIFPASTKMKKQFRYADNLGIPYMVIIGESEMASGELVLKTMKTGEQVNLTLDGIIRQVSQ